MDASQNGEKKPQLSWSQPTVAPTATPPPQTSQTAITPSTKSHTVRNVGIGGVIVLIIIGGVWALASRTKPSTSTPVTGASTTTTPTNNIQNNAGNVTPITVTPAALADGSLVIPSPQSPGMQIAITRALVTVPTWVVVYENYNGQPGNVLGAALFTHDRPSGVVELLRGTLPGQTYFVGEARDDGDHMFSMMRDPVIRDASGNPIWVKFQTN